MRYNLYLYLWLVICLVYCSGESRKRKRGKRERGNRERSKRNQIPYLENKDGVAPQGSRE